MKYFALLSIFLNSFNFYAQNESSISTYYKWFDSIIDISNTNLLNGIEFKEKYRTIEDNNQYFLTKQFLPGYVVYDGQPYYDIPMKYDIHSHELIIKLTNKNGYFAIQLLKEHIESFQIDNHRFINKSQLVSMATSDSYKGFYEVLSRNQNLSLFKKHIKNIQQRRNDRFAYSAFIYKNEFLIHYKDKISSINSKKNLIQLFPEQKKAINAFYKKNRVLMRFNYDKFLVNLMGYLNNLLKTT
ncbi:hypothetical protein [Flavivirga spongiicola]|uniref:DUF4468 domain-containing protein n=1 Tax=Flavivirga spongiicola TaxID=421621 RepID=A0ABU7XZV8_9FLAO|nr:hypothetical protein [Flavivirga sp. MEBiC05379]MDO5980404.1 hypothetical protein [Flavivirga sp. MEBiC05379]